MHRVPSVFVVVACALATGCPQSSSEGAKSSSPRSDTGLKVEKGFRKRANVPATPEQQAVFTFLDDDKQRFQTATATITPDAKASAVTKALSQYSDQLDKADASALPPAIKPALERYQKAVRELPKVLGRLPDGSFEGTALYDALYAVFRGNKDKGKPLGGDVVKAVNDMRDAGNQVYDAAGSYSLDVDR